MEVPRSLWVDEIRIGFRLGVNQAASGGRSLLRLENICIHDVEVHRICRGFMLLFTYILGELAEQTGPVVFSNLNI
jgi:hypothetical protein